jgi:hypothetical protein
MYVPVRRSMSSEHSSTFGHLSVMNVHSALFAFPDDISDVYNVAPPHLRLLVFKQYIYICIYILYYIILYCIVLYCIVLYYIILYYYIYILYYIISTIIYHDRA